MNAKLCKYLRRAAKSVGESQDLPKVAYIQHKETKVIYNHPKSVRGIYRHLKKQARKYYGNNVRRTQTTSGG